MSRDRALTNQKPALLILGNLLSTHIKPSLGKQFYSSMTRFVLCLELCEQIPLIFISPTAINNINQGWISLNLIFMCLAKIVINLGTPPEILSGTQHICLLVNHWLLSSKSLALVFIDSRPRTH